MGRRAPAVKVPHHRNSVCVRRPDGEGGSLDTVAAEGVSAQFIVELVMGSFIEKMEILGGKKRKIVTN